MSAPTNERRSIWIPAALWDRVKRAAAKASASAGEPLPTSEWVRRALLEKLERERG